MLEWFQIGLHADFNIQIFIALDLQWISGSYFTDVAIRSQRQYIYMGNL